MLGTLHRVVCAAVLFGAVSACGGGGGGGEGSAPATPVPATPAESRPLALTADNHLEASSYATSLGEALLQLGEIGLHSVRQLAAAGTTSLSTTCTNGGVLDLELTDVDQNRRPSPGDNVRATFRDCLVVLASDPTVGELTFTLEPAATGSLEAYAGTLRFGSQFAVVSRSNSADRIGVEGALRIEWQAQELRTTLRVSSVAGSDLRLTARDSTGSVTETARNVQVSKALEYDRARVSLAFAYALDSQGLGGRVIVQTPETVQAYLNTYPERGRVRVTGGSGGHVDVVPNFVVDSPAARFRYDANADGTIETETLGAWSQFTEGYLWWDPVTWPDVRQSGYQTRSFDANDFRLWRIVRVPPADADGRLSVRPKLVYQFSRELATPTSLAFEFRGAPAPVSADVRIDGARITVTPSTQLTHDSYYSVGALENDRVRDAAGNVVQIPFDQIRTRANLKAMAGAGALFAIAGADVNLVATGSTSTDGPITSHRWTQVAGTTAVITGGDTATPVVRVAAPAGGAETLAFELEIRNEAGEFARARAKLQVFADPSAARLLYFRSSAGDYIGGGATRLVSNATGAFTVTRNFDAGIGIAHEPDAAGSPEEWWRLELAAPGEVPLSPGVYESAERFPFQAPDRPGLSLSGAGRGCNTLAGRFEIFEVEYDPDGNVTRLAADFEQRCEINGPPLFGSVRIASSRPLRL